MKKTITAIVTGIMATVMSITSFAAPAVPDVLPDNTTDLTATIDMILNIFDVILGFIGEIAGTLFRG